jgi:signal transduction histidine kinase
LASSVLDDSPRWRRARRFRIAVIALVQGLIWLSQALLYEDLIFPRSDHALAYRLAELAQCLGLLWLASRDRPIRALDLGSTALFVALLPAHGLAMLVVNEPCFVPFLLTMEWGQAIIALAALLSYRSSLVLFAATWLAGVATVLLRPGFDPDLSDHVVLLLIYLVVSASIRSHERLQKSELEARQALEAAQRERALEEQRKEFVGELHDGVQAALARASLLLESSEQAITEPKIRERLLLARRAVGSALTEARAILSLHEHSTVDATWILHGIERALREAVAGLDVAISATQESDGSVKLLGAPEHHALCRLASEAGTNAIKHARAARIEGHLSIESGVVALRIQNEWSGEHDASSLSSGLGLSVARRRIERLGGKLTANLEDGKRWVVQASLAVSTPKLPARAEATP